MANETKSSNKSQADPVAALDPGLIAEAIDRLNEIEQKVEHLLAGLAHILPPFLKK